MQNGLSPAQMLMGRRILTNLPIHEDLLTPKGHKVETDKEKQKQQHDERAKQLHDLKPGDHVRIRDHVSAKRGGTTLI